MLQIQRNKQHISSLKRKHSDLLDGYRRSNDNSARINARWTSEELLIAVQGVRKYGKDCKAIAEVLGTKTEHHVRSFFMTYRRKFNLDTVLKDYEKDNTPFLDESADERIEIDEIKEDSSNDVICLSPTPNVKPKNNKVVSQVSK